MIWRIGTILASVALGFVAAHSLGASGDGYPTLRSPYPLPLVLPIFLGASQLIVPASYSVFFLLWSLPLFRGQTSIPDRSWLLFMLGVGASGLVFATGWRYGVEYQSLEYVLVSLLLSAGAAATLAVFRSRNRQRPSMATSFGFHVLLFAWFATYAFPYLGETP